ncbi:Methyltransferase domain-containing protein [Granulicella pectinivorans]|uniref:Methyltransferase domain-containing protein n=1 Tax=Granulicella pectinivorans TaxID=474950 RepID=A0A1I6MZ00_9BACT|nr:class I SAM-dependent methyltransferase [Granulicella pectinivorans]SFS20932.1 Methyltransferase domain-containing protein [Granulicella pectinivorans]
MADAMDLVAIKVKQQAAWASGDYAVVGNTIVLMAELLCEAMDVRSGWRVLDVAAGSGNASLAAARRGCWVTSTDYVPALLEQGEARAEAEGFRIAFQEADAENLPFEDGSFDAVISTVGVMFAPNQERCAMEMMRVCKAGGTIGMANWTPGGFVGQIFRCIGKYLPPPAGLKPPSVWGTEARLTELFSGVAKIETVARQFVFRSASPAAWLEGFKTYYGPMHKTFLALDEAGRAGLTKDLMELVGSLNRAEDGTMVVPSEYLEIVITR